jgi:hypothetical protein
VNNIDAVNVRRNRLLIPLRRYPSLFHDTEIKKVKNTFLMFIPNENKTFGKL